jgi:hypothetical protein
VKEEGDEMLYERFIFQLTGLFCVEDARQLDRI